MVRDICCVKLMGSVVEKLNQNLWVDAIDDLLTNIEAWLSADDGMWAFRRMPKLLQDSEYGEYEVPCLLMQLGPAKYLVEPITRESEGTLGVVDIYLLPEYDDLAGLYLDDCGWKIHYMYPGTEAVGTIKDARSREFTKTILQQVLKAMYEDASS